MAVPSAVTAFTDAATAFSAAALSSAQNGTLDASVLLSLNGLPGLCAAAVDALRAASSAPEVGDAVSAAEVLLLRCSELGDALLAQQPPIAPWVVPEDMPQMVILERNYGGDAYSRQSEFEANNPEVLGLVLVPAGTVVRLAPATVNLA